MQNNFLVKLNVVQVQIVSPPNSAEAIKFEINDHVTTRISPSFDTRATSGEYQGMISYVLLMIDNPIKETIFTAQKDTTMIHGSLSRHNGHYCFILC